MMGHVAPGRLLRQWLLGLGVFFAFGVGFVWAKEEAPPQTVPYVDLDQYMGRWYEIAAIPMFFERNCKANATAEYSRGLDGLVRVVNRCEAEKNKIILAEGRAKVLDTQTNAKLKVTFVNFLGWRFLMGGDYWIIELAPDYSYALVGHPTRKYGWILARDPLLSKKTMEHLIQKLASQGYNVCEFMITPQAGGIQVKQPLCDVMPNAASSEKYRNYKRMGWPGGWV